MLSGYRQVTDAHLVSLAAARGGVLATLDGAIATLLGASDLVEVIA